MSSGMRRGVVWRVACGVAMALMGCGGEWVFLDQELKLSELGDGDLAVVCGYDASGAARCAGGYTAGFSGEEACVEALKWQRDESGYLLGCGWQTVGEIRACLEVSACERAEAPECEKFYGCVAQGNAERDGKAPY